jgi:hypothetical protein
MAKADKEEARFEWRYNLGAGISFLALGATFVAAYINAVYGTGWDPIGFRSPSSPLSVTLGIILVAFSFAFGAWKLVSALYRHRLSRPGGP